MTYFLKSAKEHFLRFLGFYLALILHAGVFASFFINDHNTRDQLLVPVKAKHYLQVDLSLLNQAPKLKTSDKKNKVTSQAALSLGANEEKANVTFNDRSYSGTNSNSGAVENNFENTIEIFEEPIYPIVARKNGLEGEVKVIIEVNRDGNILGHKILKSSGHTILDKAVLNVIPRWKFLRREHPEVYFVEKSFIFKIR